MGQVNGLEARLDSAERAKDHLGIDVPHVSQTEEMVPFGRLKLGHAQPDAKRQPGVFGTPVTQRGCVLCPCQQCRYRV